MTDELKPCAHCNHDAKFVREIQMSPVSPVLGYILCPNCGMRTGCMLLYSEAIAAWNHRYNESDELPKWVKDAINAQIERFKNPVAISHNAQHKKADGYLMALNWLLSLRKPEEK